MKIVCKGETNPGKVRTNNEDYFGCYDNYFLYIVADGMGGHNAGEVASKLTVESIKEYFDENYKNMLKSAKSDTNHQKVDLAIIDFLVKAIKYANKVVYTRAQKNQEESGMGSTVVLLFFSHNKPFIAWVGDSRCYLSRTDKDVKRSISLISTDHSLVQEQIKEKLITQEDADKYNIKDIITRAVGFNSEVEPDCVTLKELVKDDIFMLCSDGYYRYYKLIEIGNMFITNSDFESLSNKMIETALNSGGEDNVTIVTVKLVEL